MFDVRVIREDFFHILSACKMNDFVPKLNLISVILSQLKQADHI